MNDMICYVAGAIVLLCLVAAAGLAVKKRGEKRRPKIPMTPRPPAIEGPEGEVEEALAPDAAGAVQAEIREPKTGEAESGEADPAEAEPEEITATPIEALESVPSRMQRLRAHLARSGDFGNALLKILSRGDLSSTDWEEIEDMLLMADIGLEATT